MYALARIQCCKYRVAPDMVMTGLRTMILPYGAGGEPGRGETPRKRSSNTIDFGAIEVLEDQMDIEAPELGIRLILSEGLSVCTPLQRERIQKYYIEGMSLSEIAEGKNISTVQQSIDAGIKKMKNFFGVDP